MSASLGSIRGRGGTAAEQGHGLRNELHLTRFYGGLSDGPCVQLTIGHLFVQLDRRAIRRLATILDEEAER